MCTGSKPVLFLLLLAALSSCGTVPPIPEWATVSPEQIAEAKRLDVPVAYEELAAGVRFVLVPASDAGGPALYVATTETTNRQYRCFRPGHRSTFNDDDQPVDVVRYGDAVAFATWVSRESARPGYRLPTEEEWERACRAGTSTAFAFGERLAVGDANVHHPSRHKGRTTPAGSYVSNRWGLYDMHGNLWEWCVLAGDSSDPPQRAVLRGGSWRHPVSYARSDHRQEITLEFYDPDVGFRLVRGIRTP